MTSISGIRTLTLSPGDVLVVNVPGALGADEEKSLKAELKRFLRQQGHPEVETLVLCNGMTLDVMRKA